MYWRQPGLWARVCHMYLAPSPHLICTRTAVTTSSGCTSIPSQSTNKLYSIAHLWPSLGNPAQALRNSFAEDALGSDEGKICPTIYGLICPKSSKRAKPTPPISLPQQRINKQPSTWKKHMEQKSILSLTLNDAKDVLWSISRGRAFLSFILRTEKPPPLQMYSWWESATPAFQPH